MVLLLAAAFPAHAQQRESAWVTDQFEITMRNGKSNRQAIVRMLPSGTRVERLETDNEAGYARVRTSSGAEGWVLTRYLLNTPPARVTLPGVQQQLARSEEQRQELGRPVTGTCKPRMQRSNSSSASPRTRGTTSSAELARIRSLSSKTVQIDAENRQLKQVLAETQQALDDAEAESRRLASRSNREWFVIGALVVMFGILVGLILPRIRWKKKSSWGEL